MNTNVDLTLKEQRVTCGHYRHFYDGPRKCLLFKILRGGGYDMNSTRVTRREPSVIYYKPLYIISRGDYYGLEFIFQD